MICGIICEGNPTHTGHEYLIQAAKAGGNTVVCLMSGCFVQRGDVAIADSHTRAQLLLLAGADLVLELPFPHSASGSEFFGRAGVEILDKLGVDELWFGSESGDLERLQRFAEAMTSDVIAQSGKIGSRSPIGTAEGYCKELSRMAGEKIPPAPNELLAISYLAAMKKLGSRMVPRTKKRVGSGYNEKVLSEGAFPSATALREQILAGHPEELSPYLPKGGIAVLKQAQKEGNLPAGLEAVESLILFRFRSATQKDFESVFGLSGGLGEHMKKAANQAASLQEFLELSATKKYPDARIRREILYLLCHVSESDLKESPKYVRLLAANTRGRKFLASLRKKEGFPIVTKQSEIPKDAVRQEALERLEHGLFTLCLPKKEASEKFLKQKPRME